MRAPTRWPGAIAAALLLAACGADVASPTLDDAGLQAEAEAVEEETSAADDAGESEEPTAVATSEPDGTVETELEDPGATETDEVATQDGAGPAPSDADAAPTCTLSDEDAGIQVLSPVAGASVGTTFTVTGCGNTFEATYIYEVVLDDGGVVAGGFGTMTCGTGCVGTFEEDVTASGDGPATLVLFEEDARDGGRANVVEVAIVIVP